MCSDLPALAGNFARRDLRTHHQIKAKARAMSVRAPTADPAIIPALEECLLRADSEFEGEPELNGNIYINLAEQLDV